jgi:hypothetical protein
MHVNIETIPINDMRYNTCGDFWIDKDGTIQVRVAKMGFCFEFLVVLHELVELFICKSTGVNFKDIDKFDIRFEKDREKGKHGESDEPGDHPAAPYRDPHCLATAVERMLCAYLKIPWSEYDSTVLCLDYDPKPKKEKPLVCAVE